MFPKSYRHPYPKPVLWIRTHFLGFGSTIFFRIRILIHIYINPKIFKLVPLIAFIPVPVFWNLYDKEKSFPTEKLRFFSPFKCFICDFAQQCDPNLNPNPNFFRIRIQPKYSYYFGVVFTTLTQTRYYGYLSTLICKIPN
jgi:hypothetical protein